MIYQEALDFLYSQLPMYQRVGKIAFKKDLTNTKFLCQSLGNPERKFKSIHIAGTNGKGTTAHILASILQESGYKTGLYTSPHLKSYTERIRINGLEIEESFVIDFVEKIRDDIVEIQPSFFELTVAMAFAYFADQEVDIAVIETGLGGRLDSTNVIFPEVAAITNISLDHQEMLGDTIEEIAREKAGIIKKNVPVVLGKLGNSTKKVMLDVAQTTGAKVNDDFEDYKIINSLDGNFDVYKNNELILNALECGVKGSYIKEVIPHCLEIINTLGDMEFDITPDSIKSGFSKVVLNTNLKGRWQIIDKEPLMICDIAHNRDGLKQIIRQLNELTYNELHFVFGVVADKSVDTILKILPKNAKYYFCAANIPRALDVDTLYEMAVLNGLAGGVFSSVNKAIKAAKINAGNEDLIFIGGSTFVVAEIDEL